MTMRLTLVGSAMVVGLLAGCAADDDRHFRDGLELRGGVLVPRPDIQLIPAPLPGAHCEIDVEFAGVISMEEDYLPHVITCENGGANLEALKAQAIAARSVAYYAIETDGGICDSQGCQVYSCGNEPTALAYQAVLETAGQYLSYNSTLTYGFYVAGDSGVDAPGCVGVDGNAATEHWITYNSGRTGTDVQQTQLGFVHDPGDNGYGQNRGCMGQWAARCLENDNGVDVTGILQFFYGSDIGITQALGECVAAMPGDTGEPGTISDGPVDTGAEDPTDASATSVPPTTSLDSSASSDEGSASVGQETSASDGSDDGTGGAGGAALPDTFGELEGQDGCGCSGGTPQQAPSALALGVVLVLSRRRKIAG